jgi:DNA-binding transcriptional MerR regulator
MNENFLTTGESGKILELSSERVRQLEREGQLKAMRTAKGQRIFRLDDIEAFKRKRSSQR